MKNPCRSLHFAAALIFFSLLPAALSGEERAKQIELTFVGDVMTHSTQLRRAWLGTDDEGQDKGYDFSPSFEWIQPFLNQSDFTMGNLETTFGGPHSALVKDEKYAFREYQAYPCFTTPDELADTLKSCGFDLLGTANNHSMDSNLEGVSRTIEVLGRAGIPSTGTAAEGSPEPWRGTVGGFKISIMAWTQSVNGIVSSRGMERVNVFSARGKNQRLEEMLQEIRDEAALNPDVLILFTHWGQEYRTEPNEVQKSLANLAIEAGVDIIIGSHPHTLQPVELRRVERNGQEEEVLIAWSLGNFISSQRHGEAPKEWVDGSAILNLRLEEGEDRGLRLNRLSMLPVYVQWAAGYIRVLPPLKALDEKDIALLELSDYDRKRLKALDEWAASQLVRYMGALPALCDRGWWRLNLP